MTRSELSNLISEYSPRLTRKTVLISAGIFLLITVFVLYGEFKKMPDGKLQVVFCDVGQGDAVYLKTPKGLDILVDGGPDDKVLTCLRHQMPFWNRKIEMVFLTHPHLDHLTGLLSVVDRYEIGTFFRGSGKSREIPYEIFLKKLKGLKNDILFAGDQIKTGDGVIIDTLWPPASFETDDLNNKSLVLKINKILLTGDASLSNLIGDDLSGIEILKVPHHGSKTAMDESVLRQMSSLKTAIISVGKNNDFGHPAPETISLLESLGIKIKRTDLDGEIFLTP